MAELNEVNNEATPEVESTEEKFTYTKAELDALLQKEGDRRVSSALKKQEGKYKEAQKLERMNSDERFQYELEQREKAIAEKEQALALAENKNVAGKILAEKGLSLDLIDFVVVGDADEMNNRIKSLERAFKASVKREVENRLKSPSPVTNINNGVMTKEQFKKLSLDEKQSLFNNDRDLYNSLK